MNLSGVYYCCKAALPAMIAQRYGKIVNIASVSAAKGGSSFGNVLYGTTKAGVVAMTRDSRASSRRSGSTSMPLRRR